MQTLDTGIHDVENLVGGLFKRVGSLFHRSAQPVGGGGVASPAQIASALGVPQGDFQANWPYIAKALADAGMTDKNTIIAALATIKTETGSFQPIPEYGTGAEYNGRADLGNTQPGDGPRYKGRGYIQLTGRANYTSYGQKLGVNLVNNPDLALQPNVAAKVLVQYFKDHGIPAMAQSGNWMGVRRAVNGGLNGWDTFLGAVDALKGLNLSVNGVPAPPDPTPAPAPSPSPAPGPGPGGTYTVQPGDSLSAIARRVLGDANRWTEIYNLNRDQISDPNRIYPGQVLKLPGAAQPAPAPPPAPAMWHIDLPTVPGQTSAPAAAAPAVATPAAPVPTPIVSAPAVPGPIATPATATAAVPTPVVPTPVTPTTTTPIPVPTPTVPVPIAPTPVAPTVPVPVAPTPVAPVVPTPVAPNGTADGAPAMAAAAPLNALPGFLTQGSGVAPATQPQQELATIASQAEWLIQNTPAQS